MNALQSDILDHKREWVAARRKEGVEGVYKAQALALPLPPSLHDALRVARADRAVIAELMRSSPRTGASYDIDLAEAVAGLEAAGATAIAIRVDDAFYGGSYADVLVAAQTTSLPILVRDVVIDPVQITMARAHGAAGVTLDPSTCGERELRALFRCALDLGLDVVAEARSVTELEMLARIRRSGAESAAIRILGIDATSAEDGMPDHTLYDQLASAMPEHAVALALGTTEDPADVARLESVGYDAFLVAEPLMAGGDPAKSLHRWAGEPLPSV